MLGDDTVQHFKTQLLLSHKTSNNKGKRHYKKGNAQEITS